MYMEPTVEEALDMEPIVEEENINRTIDEDVGLPPSNYQEESEGQQVATETPERIVDALDDRNPTPLPPLESTRREIRSVYKLMKDSSIPLKVRYLNVVLLIKLSRY